MKATNILSVVPGSWLKRLAFVSILLLVAAGCGTRVTPGPDPSASASGAGCGRFTQTITGTILLASELSDRCRVFAFRNPLNNSAGGVHEADGYRITLGAARGVELGEWARGPVYATPPPADVRIEVDAEAIRGSPRDLFGVVCRFSAALGATPATMYVLMVGRDGSYLVEFVTATPSGQPVNDRTLASGFGPVPRIGSNHFRVDCVGNRLTLYLNGQQVASVDDDGAPSGLSGIYARTIDAVGAEFLFRNFLVIKP